MIWEWQSHAPKKPSNNNLATDCTEKHRCYILSVKICVICG
jgi:hypothetical protein